MSNYQKKRKEKNLDTSPSKNSPQHRWKHARKYG